MADSFIPKPNTKVITQLDHRLIRETYFDEYGLPVERNYYYDNLSNPCTVLEFDTKLGKHIVGYKLIEKDLNDIKSFIDEYEKIINLDIDVLIKALFRAIVITYGKCFVSTSGRQIKLEQDKLPHNLKEIHGYLMDIRHSYVAHAGHSIHEKAKHTMIIPPSPNNSNLQLCNQIFITEFDTTITYGHFIPDMNLLISYFQERVSEKINNIQNQIDTFISELKINEIEHFKKKQNYRIQITDINK